MSLDAQNWVWEYSRSKGTARLVLLAIADKASGRDCSAYAGTTMLMQRANAARSSVIAAVDTLIGTGELEIVPGRRGPRGETRYRLPAAIGHTRQDPARGGPESVPVQDPDRYEIRTPGGPDSVPPRSEICTPRGPDSGPHNAVNAIKRKGNAEREGDERPKPVPRAAAPPVALALIPSDWQPTIHDVRTAQAARTAAFQPTLTGAQLAEVTRKFVRRQMSDRRALPSDAWGARWQEWAERERPTETGQPALLLGLAGGLANLPVWAHEQPSAGIPRAVPAARRRPVCPGCERPFADDGSGPCRTCREPTTETA